MMAEITETFVEQFGTLLEDSWGWLLFAGMFLGGFSWVAKLIRRIPKYLDKKIQEYSYIEDDRSISDKLLGNDGNVYIDNSNVSNNKVTPKRKVKTKKKREGTFGYDPKIGGSK